jgi:hypothetical protein
LSECIENCIFLGEETDEIAEDSYGVTGDFEDVSFGTTLLSGDGKGAVDATGGLVYNIEGTFRTG